jgi:hypothetical protein
MKKYTIFLFFVSISVFVNGNVLAKSDKPNNTTQSIVEEVLAVDANPSPAPTNSQSQPTSAPVAPTQNPSPVPTNAPQPTAKPTQVIQPTVEPQPTTTPIVAAQLPTLEPTRAPIIGGSNTGDTTKDNPKPKQNTDTKSAVNDDYHPYDAATQPTAAPIASTKFADPSQPAPVQAVQKAVGNAVSTVSKVIPPPIFSLFKSNKETYYADAKLTADETVTLLSSAFLLFISGIFLVNTSFHKYFSEKLTYLRTLLF